MNFRKIVSLSIALSFLILLVTGILSFYQEYTRPIATIHTVFGFVFTAGVCMHLSNNILPFRKYIKGWIPLSSLAGVTILLGSAYIGIPPIQKMMAWGAKSKATGGKEVTDKYEFYELDISKDIQLSLDLLRGEHYWHPQIAIWTEDSLGNYIETLFVSKATAKGLFFGGRSKDNFKTFDAEKNSQSKDYRRVNALPVWSRSRGILYDDGMYVPTREKPIADAISGATPIESFKMKTSIEQSKKFTIRLEINVAFDDNEHYSEFDYADDEVFHSGTGQLGQPSLIFAANVDLEDGQDYYFMKLLGHGHHSGQSGEIYEDLSHLTTSLEIVERIVLSVKENKET